MRSGFAVRQVQHFPTTWRNKTETSQGYESEFLVLDLCSWNLVFGFWFPDLESQILGPGYQLLGTKSQDLDQRSWDLGHAPLNSYYKAWQEIITKCGRYYKVRYSIIRKRDRYYKVRRAIITKCENYYKVRRTIMTIIFWDFLMFYQDVFSSQAKPSVIISNKHGIYGNMVDQENLKTS